jgi:hypothetical protein
MRFLPLNDHKRLELLNANDSSHQWRSCDERRACVLCERVFTGREVRLHWFRRGVTQIQCATPGCAGGPPTWVHPENPLVSQEAWEDWERLIRDTEAAAS